jgi:CRISPR system Cascade subunit CasC
MILELHLIQNFAPSNLNRNDTGSPKDCTFGGYRRARISSQCFKRAIRWESNFKQVLEENGGSVRTRRLIVEIAKQIASEGKELEKVTKLVSEIFKEGGIERPEKGEEGEKENTRLVFFMNKQTISEMAQEIRENLDNLANKETKAAVITKLAELLANSVKSPDIALFGRMLEIKSDKPFGKKNLGIDAASQVAHAISTHKVGLEFDYFTAVDDLLEKGQVGAGMIGTIEFNSACFYRYANVNIDKLEENLAGGEKQFAELKGDDLKPVKELSRATIEAFIRSAIEAIPTGKQTWSATHETPDFILAVVRDSTRCSMANAFVKPVKATEKQDLIAASVEAFENRWEKVATGYGDDSFKKSFNISNYDLKSDSLKGTQEARIDDLVNKTVAKIFNQEA